MASGDKIRVASQSQVSDAGVTRNGLVTNGALALPTTEVTGSIPVLYTGNGTSQDISTPMQIANDNGDGTTLAIDWVNGSFSVGDVAIDNTTTGDALAYENITGTSTATSPRLDTTNWKLAYNQYGGRFWFKSRGNTRSNNVQDSIRRKGNYILTDQTLIEVTDIDTVTAFNPFSITIGTSNQINESTFDHVVWIDQTTRKTPGYRTDVGVIQNSKDNTGTDLLVKDSAGNGIIEHYNPTTGFSIIMDTGNGVAGRNIPHSLQNKPSVFIKKQLTTTARPWMTYNVVSGATKILKLDDTIVATLDATAWNSTSPTEDNCTLGSSANTNANTEQYITYLQAESDNHVIKSYTGSGAVGNVVDLGLDMTVAGSYITIKRLDAIGNWLLKDNSRGGVSNNGKTLYADTSAAEEDVPSYEIDYTANGIIINGDNLYINTSGGLYLIQAYSPKYSQPTGGSLININAGVDLTYTNGIGNTNKLETTSAHTVDCSGNAGDTTYILKEHGSNATSVVQGLSVGTDRLDADRWGVTTADGLYKTTARHGSAESETGFVSASGVYNGEEAHRAFSKTNCSAGCRWIIATTTISWIEYDTVEFKKLKSFKLFTNDSELMMPKRWKLTALNESDVRVDVFTDYELSDFPIPAVYTGSSLLDVSSDIPLRAFRIEITENNGNATYTAIGEIEFNFEISDASYLNTVDKVVYDSSDVATNQVALGECKVDESGNTFDLVEYQADKAYINDLVVQGEVSLNNNVRIVDFGTVFINSRYVIENPFGNENYIETELQYFVDNIWTKITGTTVTDGTAQMAGGVSGLVAGVGVVVKTAQHYLTDSNGRNTTLVNTNSNQTSLPCRVIVTKIGDAK